MDWRMQTMVREYQCHITRFLRPDGLNFIKEFGILFRFGFRLCTGYGLIQIIEMILIWYLTHHLADTLSITSSHRPHLTVHAFKKYCYSFSSLVVVLLSRTTENKKQRCDTSNLKNNFIKTCVALSKSFHPHHLTASSA